MPTCAQAGWPLAWAVAGLIAGTVFAEAAGALAIGACGAYGTAYDFADVTVARSRALATCRGRGCKVVAPVRRACAAYALDGSNPCGSYGWAVRPRLGAAQNAAMREC